MLTWPVGLQPYPFQLEGRDWLLERGCTGILADDMGLGKTVQAIIAANAVPEIRKVLVVTTATLKFNWHDEWKKWCTKGLNVSVVFKEDVRTEADVIIINYDLLERNAEVLTSIVWDLVILDEGHRVKNHEAKRTVRLLGLTTTKIENGQRIKTRHKAVPARRRMVITGTPIQGKPIELFPLLWWVDPKRWSDPAEYVRRYCQTDATIVVMGMRGNSHNMKIIAGKLRWPKSQWERDVKPHLTPPFPNIRETSPLSGASNLGELGKEVAPYILRRLKADVLKELPPKIHQIIPISPEGRAAARVQKQIEQWQMCKSVMGANPSWDEVFKEFRGELDFAEIRRELAMEKIPWVQGIIDDAIERGQTIIVFGYHVDALNHLFATNNDKYGAGIITGDVPSFKRDQFKKDFQAGKLKVFFGQYQASGEGITLTSSHRVLFIEPDWTPAIMAQAADRAHRIGQREKVLCQYLIWLGSVEEMMIRKLVKKQRIIERTLSDAEWASWFFGE